jgi:hypothetical protein
MIPAQMNVPFQELLRISIDSARAATVATKLKADIICLRGELLGWLTGTRDRCDD